MFKDFKFHHGLIAFYVLISFGSYIDFVYPIVSKPLLVIAALMFPRLRFEITFRRVILFLFLLMLYIHVSITMDGKFHPRENSLLLPLFAFISRRDMVSIYISFVWMEALSIIPSVIILVMHIFGIDSFLPTYTIDVGRPFIVFPGTAIQPGQFTTIGGIKFFRISGIQDEPGLMSGIVLFILIAEKFDLKPLRNKFLLFAGLLSFSFAFYILLAVYLLFSFFIDTNIRKRIIDARLVLLISFIVLILSGFYEFYIQSRLQGIDFSNPDPYSLRISMTYGEFYDFFFSQDFNYIMFGHGITADKIHNAYAGAQSMNFMGFFYNYGIIGFFLLISSISLITQFKSKSAFVAFVIILLSFYQRPYIFNVGYFLLFFAIAYSLTTFYTRDIQQNVLNQSQEL